MATGGSVRRATPKLAVYCAYAWRLSTMLTTWQMPMTSPPLTTGGLVLQDLVARVVYLRLHGVDGSGKLYGDDGRGARPIALTAAQIASLDWRGAVVYLEGCNGDDVAGAFLGSGAGVVVGDTDTSWGRRWFLGPSSWIGKFFLSGLRRGATTGEALDAALNHQKIKMLPKELRSGLRVFGNKDTKL